MGEVAGSDGDAGVAEQHGYDRDRGPGPLELDGVSVPSVRSRRVQKICVAIRAGAIRVVNFASLVVPGVAIPAVAV